jgi:DNA-binding CsgD family transcriptional regulator
MATAKTHHQALAELRALGTAHQRGPTRMSDVAPLFARLLSSCKTLGVEERAGGIAFRLEGAAGKAEFSITCLLHHSHVTSELTTAEHAVAKQLCEGRTLAQIASLRGVSANTVKSQVRQIFRKLDVESRVALVRKLSP